MLPTSPFQVLYLSNPPPSPPPPPPPPPLLLHHYHHQHRNPYFTQRLIESRPGSSQSNLAQATKSTDRKCFDDRTTAQRLFWGSAHKLHASEHQSGQSVSLANRCGVCARIRYDTFDEDTRWASITAGPTSSITEEEQKPSGDHSQSVSWI
ncbi:hypothetical protein HDV57DRAFT_38070 [Trichoderma longibrachiatum]|uniref:Uncharacterized protein n=1 Tax=Trichoderma longibrachiatum ATCC 18648 TaxID=983965 RepID=A0A2T4CHM2_TRILO|nr:hypothetical protein M440DRAFT_75610 [Trichoderma longibrachiatum ATCC 18648]